MIRERQTVTGIIVNGKTSLPKHYVRSLQATIHNWENYGYEISSMLHEHFYKREKGFLKYNGAIPNIEQVVHGKIEYLGMVRGKEDTTYRLLRMKFDSLCKKENYTPKEFKEILEIWKSQGIKKAMDKFYDRKNLLING